jgi:two-component system LytT family sensor kinase
MSCTDRILSRDSMLQAGPAPPKQTRTEKMKGKTNWLAIIGVWSLFGVWFGNQTFVDMHSRGMHHSYVRMLIWGWLVGMTWVPITPLLLSMAKRFPFERSALLRSIPIHLILYAILSLYTNAAKQLVSQWMHPFDPLVVSGSFGQIYASSFLGNLATTLAIYVAFVGVAHALEYRKTAREQELHAAQLQALLSQAQVLSLKMQLHPHFLFNTLNGIVALVRDRENESAVQMLVGLSNMLRYALESSEQQEVPLSEEIEFLNLYLGLEKMRFPDRLTVEMQIDPATREAMVPNLLLQPIAENAIRHGISQTIAAGKLMIRSVREDSHLVLTIEDDGVGLSPQFDERVNEGIGLKNTRSRLAQLYGENWSLTLKEQVTGGVAVRISLPFNVAAAEPALLN